MDYRGNDIGEAKWVENEEACAKLSASNERALYWTFVRVSNQGWIKTSKAGWEKGHVNRCVWKSRMRDRV